MRKGDEEGEGGKLFPIAPLVALAKAGLSVSIFVVVHACCRRRRELPSSPYKLTCYNLLSYLHIYRGLNCRLTIHTCYYRYI